MNVLASRFLAVLTAALASGPALFWATPCRAEEDWSALPVPVREVEAGKARWVGSYEEALLEAKLRHAPVLVLMGQDTSGPMDYQLSRVFLTPGFAKATTRWVTVIAMQGRDHDSEEVETEYGNDTRCKVFGVPCDDHNETYDLLFRNLIHRTFWNPLIFVLDPEGNEVFRLEGSKHSLSRLEEELRFGAGQVAKKFGKPMKESVYRKLLNSMARVRELRGDGEVQKALQKLGEIGKSRNLTPGWDRFLAAEKADILAEGTRTVLAVLAEAEDDPRGAVARLRKLLREYAGTDVEEQARKAIVRIEEKDE